MTWVDPTSGRFEQRGELGRGSMGVVWRVFDEELGREVALKSLPRVEPQEVFFLKREYRSLAGLHHPNVAELYELFVDDAGCFFTMELIEGRPFGIDLDPSELDAAKIRAWLGQLARALEFLHSQGKLHRDVKPHNVLVTDDDRVVVLDFGLVAELRTEPGRDEVGMAHGGTLAYMAPERIFGRETTPASDWYGVGALLHETLTGRLPYDGDLSSRLAHPGPRPDKLGRESRVSDADLVELCCRLLKADVQARAGVREVLAAAGEEPTAPPRVRPSDSDELVGRNSEMRAFDACLERSSAGEVTLLSVEGPSGIGKTSFLRSAMRRAGEHVVLRGRCHPSESVPYRMWDGVIDELSRYLVAQPPTELSALLPQEASLAGQLFPVLRRLPQFAPSDRFANVDRSEVRLRGAAALAELIANVAERRPLLLWVDDVQWADVDSLPLLRSVLAQQGPVLVVFSHRSEARERSSTLERISELEASVGPRATRLSLQPLTEEDAVELFRRVSGRDELDPQALRYANGSPFLVRELARLPSRSEHDWAHGLLERMSASAEGARDLMEVVSAAGRPVGRRLALESAGMRTTERPLVSRLCEDRLLRMRETDEGTFLLPYHDRIREAVVASMSEEGVRDRHRALLEALENMGNADIDLLADHAIEADEPEKAATYAIGAAERAMAALAFEQAAHRYRQALDRQPVGENAWQLRERYADALANAGRGGDAAPAYERAADELASYPGPADVQPSDLRRAAAEQYLRSGRHEDGRSLLSSLLEEVGESMPGRPQVAMLQSMVGRSRLLFRRRLGPSARAASEDEQRRLEVLWGVSSSIVQMNFAISDALFVRHLLGALETNDRGRIARALAVEATFEAAFGAGFLRDRSARLLARAGKLADEGGTDYDEAWVTLGHGVKAWLESRWTVAAERTEAAAVEFRHCARGADYEIALAELYGMSARAFLGQVGELTSRVPAALANAEARGDLFAANNHRLGEPAICWLIRDELETARANARHAEQTWPSDDFHNQRYLHLIAAVHADLYAGDAASAWKAVERRWPAMKRGQFLLLVVPRIELLSLRGKAAAAYALAGGGDEWAPSELLEEAERCADRIARDSVPMAKPTAAALRARVLEARGARERARGIWAEAAQGFDVAEMALHREMARRAAGEHTPADEWLTAAGVVAPSSLARIF